MNTPVVEYSNLGGDRDDHVVDMTEKVVVVVVIVVVIDDDDEVVVVDDDDDSIVTVVWRIQNYAASEKSHDHNCQSSCAHSKEMREKYERVGLYQTPHPQKHTMDDFAILVDWPTNEKGSNPLVVMIGNLDVDEKRKVLEYKVRLKGRNL